MGNGSSWLFDNGLNEGKPVPFLCSSKERVAPKKGRPCNPGLASGFSGSFSANSPCGLKHAEPCIRLNPLASMDCNGVKKINLKIYCIKYNFPAHTLPCQKEVWWVRFSCCSSSLPSEKSLPAVDV